MEWPRASQRALAALAAAILVTGLVGLRRDPREASAVPPPVFERIDLRLDLNRATPRELEALPGIGPALAGAIAAHRTRHGPFRSLEDLRSVAGLRAATVEKVRPYLSVADP